MNKIEIKRWDTGAIIFSHECEDNIVKITLEKGVAEGVDFNWAELNGAKLNGAELNGAKLNWAELSGAELPITDIIINDRYHVHIRPDYIKIGCEKHTPGWFKKLTQKKADEVDGAGKWWKYWKPVILGIWEQIKDREI